MKSVVLTVFLVVGTSSANIDNYDYSYGDETISDLAGKLPTYFVNKLPAEVLSFEYADKSFKEKCYKLTGSDEAFNKASVAKYGFQTCVRSQVNVNELQKDIISAKLPDDLDSIFGKYCRKTPTVITCVKDFLPAVDPCLETQEKEDKNIMINMTEIGINFWCDKDGHRIASVFKCLLDKQDIQHCVEKTLGKKIQTDNNPLFIIEKEQCHDLTALQTWFVAELERRSEPTHANIMDALIKFIKKVTNCEKLTANSKSVNFNNANVVIISVFMFATTLFVRYF